MVGLTRLKWFRIGNANLFWRVRIRRHSCRNNSRNGWQVMPPKFKMNIGNPI